MSTESYWLQKKEHPLYEKVYYPEEILEDDVQVHVGKVHSYNISNFS